MSALRNTTLAAPDTTHLDGATIKTANRWAKSFQSPPLRPPCHWRRHLKFTAHTVFGYLVHQAKKDPINRFAFPGWRDIQRNANDLGVKLNRRQIFALLKQFRVNGMIVKAIRHRPGHPTLAGWIVRNHDDYTLEFPSIDVCGLMRDFDRLTALEAGNRNARGLKALRESVGKRRESMVNSMKKTVAISGF
jgi:hypothetical protein